MKFLVFFLLGASLLEANVETNSFAGNNDPSYIVKDAVYEFDRLPKKARLSEKKTPWTNTFWPHIYGGIAFRWNGFYSGEPSFAPLHYQIDRIDEELAELEEKLYKESNSVSENKRIVSKITSLRNEKRELNIERSKDYKTYFFDLKRLRRASQAANLSQQELDRLSPAEKFDIYSYMKTGKDNAMTLTRDVLNLTNPSDAFWEGICHGWASASLEFAEPQPQTITARGINLRLGSSDLKALLSYYHAAITRNWITNKRVNVGRVGERCNVAFSKHAWFMRDGVEYYKTIQNGQVKVQKVPADCVDMDPGAFHIVMANMIAFKNQGFIAEAVRDREVWNQPVYEYETTVEEESAKPRRFASPGTVKQVLVKTKMYYSNDGGRMFWREDGSIDEFYAWWDATNGTDNFRFEHKEFEYYLDLDRSGKIIGGQWLSYERPDFLWAKKSRGFIGTGTFFGIVNYLHDLKDLTRLQ